MTVEELINLLKACDQKAMVVINDTAVIEGDRNIMDGAMAIVEAVEPGWTSPDIESDLPFSLRPIGSYLIPAVRLLGHNDEPTDPEQKLTINGISPMKEATKSK